MTVTNTGSGRVTVHATGSAAVTVTHTGDDDFTYPAASEPVSHVTVSGSHAADVAPTLTGNGFISVYNEGGHVATTLTGDGQL